MLTVDRERFAADALALGEERFARLLPRAGGRRYALCLKHPFDLVCAVLHLKRAGASAVLLPSDTPPMAVLQKAKQAACSGIVGCSLDRFDELEGGISGEQPAVLQFSSGTTGLPKLAVRSWTEIDAEIAHYNEALRFDADETPVVLVPVSHSFGLIAGVLSAFERGARPVVVTNANPKFALGTIGSTAQPIVYAVPFQLQVLLSMCGAGFRFHKAVSSGSPLTGPLLARLRSHAGEAIQQYGCSEAGCISVGYADEPMCVGRPLKHVVVRTGGTAARPAPITVTIGNKEIDTGDIGYAGDRGDLFVAGRKDDVINVSGRMVLPSEVERVIDMMPGVRESVVYRIPHPVWGEAVKAMVEAGGDVTAERIKAWCVERLPRYQVPGDIAVVKRIPRAANGKISRKRLSEQEGNHEQGG